MKKVTVRAPVRADLAGGTLDLWPLYLFHPGARTVNVAISYHAESEVARIAGDSIENFSARAAARSDSAGAIARTSPRTILSPSCVRSPGPTSA